MGVLMTHEKYDWETIAKEIVEYIVGDETYYIEYRLREYERYGRFLISRSRTRRVQIHARAYDHEPQHSSDPHVGRSTPIAEQKSMWDKDRGPSHSFEYQMSTVTDIICRTIDDRVSRKSKLEDAIPERVA